MGLTYRFRRDLLEGARWCFLAARAVLSRRVIPLPHGYATVTLTTHRARHWAAMLAVDSLARGALRPARVVLFLDGRSYSREHLPFPLAVLARRGVDVVCLDEDYGSYTKLPVFAWSPEPQQMPVITMDDDVLYPSDWLLRFRDSAALGGNEILCYHARAITLDDAGAFAPYLQWELVRHTEARYDLLPLGVYGVLYTRDALEAIRRKGLAFRIAPNVDDLWFRLCTIERGIKARRVVSDVVRFPPAPFTERAAIYPGNVFGGGNDRKIALIAPLFDLSVLRNECGAAGRSER